MKVLVFTTTLCKMDGAERLAVDLAEDLNKRGIHTDILSMYTEDMPGVTEAKQSLLQKGIPNVHFLGMRIHPSIASLVPAIWRLRRLIREQRYDIVETSMVSPTVLASWGTRCTKARHVAGLHHSFIIDRENSKQHKFWRFSARKNRRIRYYAISDYVRNCWIAYSNTPPAHTRTVYNGIPDDCFHATRDRQGVCAELEIPENSKLLVYVGRLAVIKGCDTLLEAVGPLLEANNSHLLLVGSLDPHIQGSNEMVRQMKDQIETNGWGNRIRFLGYRIDVPRLLASSDILVHPTRLEGFGLTLVEAMAANLPVVTTNIEGIPEVLSGTDSILVPPDDPDAFRQAVLKTMNRTKEESTAAIERGRTRATDFRMEKRSDAMIQLFEDVRSGNF
jgi:glycosyltransferase involved in cell wall biosynthesis